jgi:hypothetical protein
VRGEGPGMIMSYSSEDEHDLDPREAGTQWEQEEDAELMCGSGNKPLRMIFSE